MKGVTCLSVTNSADHYDPVFTSYEVWYSDIMEEIVNNFKSCSLVADEQYLHEPPEPRPYGVRSGTTSPT
ncbi:hypothetical protein Hamer_G017469 [Homarus americanus]|uniref:Uncharacterized protein n=1 Tax=Homarus americanus TaxID=6706 RepID=A0A8J5JS86_HOMAM|nr:hypothetical protein Hamer_G017469 [Homarus americanus]